MFEVARYVLIQKDKDESGDVISLLLLLCLSFTFDLVNLVHASFEDDMEDLFSILLKEARLVKGVGCIYNKVNGLR
jgi:hypothetical protein